MKPTQILVPLDGSEAALAALPIARSLAALFGTRVRILHVSDEPPAGRALLEKLHLRPDDTRDTVVDVVGGAPHRAIVEAQASCDCLVVMTAHAGEPDPRIALGPVSQAVLIGTRHPVILVPPGMKGTWKLEDILLPHDGSPTTAHAFEPAADLAALARARLTVLHVSQLRRGAPKEAGTLAAPRYTDQPQYEWPSWAAEFLERLVGLGSLPPERMSLAVTHGRPGPEIVRLAHERSQDLIVLAWRGALDPAQAHAARAVFRRSPCPVLVLRVAEPEAPPYLERATET